MKFPAAERAAPERPAPAPAPAVADRSDGAPVITVPDVTYGTRSPAPGRPADGFLQRSA
ncbi:hypothetical protein KYY02_30900 [Streptomyces pimonensis]|uniref:Uncharacterized protein n=1 Tax=Streptomyces pimonensis TaxID=2860288 RepID=A0ABV4J7P5_9ACTN